MRTTWQQLRRWLLPITWAAVIFGASADTDSSARSSRLIGPLVRWVVPEISPEALDRTVFTVRKAAHATEYAILAILVWIALRRPTTAPNPWRLAWALTAAYAITDEVHQTLVPGRTGTATDVALDAAGAALGLLLIRLWARRRSELCARRPTDTVPPL